MEPENENFSKRTILKRKVKRPDTLLCPSTFGQISAKYCCTAYKLREDNGLTRINFENLIDKSIEGSCVFRGLQLLLECM